MNEQGSSRAQDPLPLPEATEEDLHLLTHLRACLCDGGRERGREHPHGQDWFSFFGRRLWRRFHPAVAGALAATERTRILLQIELDDSDRLGRVLGQAPWELSRFPVDYGVRDEPLGTSERIAVSRYVNVPGVPGDFEAFGPELRVLFVESTHGATMRGEAVRRAIAAHPGIRLTRWTPQQVFDCIRTVEGVGQNYDLVQQRFDVIQILAHGREDDGRVRIRLSDEIELSAMDLARFVRGRCRVVFLESCSSAGAVRELLSAGPLAVLAMLYDISVEHLVQFNYALYQQLLQGAQLDVAVQTGRHALDAEARVSCCGAPVLYVRTCDPIELRLDPQPRQPTLEPPRPSVPEPAPATGPADAISSPRPRVPAPPRESQEADTGAVTLLDLLSDRSTDV